MRTINPEHFDHFVISAGWNAAFYNWAAAKGNWLKISHGQFFGVKPDGEKVLIDMR